jgi:hypothetical protein
MESGKLSMDDGTDRRPSVVAQEKATSGSTRRQSRDSERAILGRSPAALGRSKRQESGLTVAVFLIMAYTPTWATLAGVGYAAVRFSTDPYAAVLPISVSTLVSVYLLLRLDGQGSQMDVFKRAITLDPKYLVMHSARWLRVLRAVLAANFVVFTATTMAFASVYVFGGQLLFGAAIAFHLAREHQRSLGPATRLLVTTYAVVQTSQIAFIVAAAALFPAGWRAAVAALTVAALLALEPRLFHTQLGVAMTADSAKQQILKLNKALMTAGHGSLISDPPPA